MGKLGQSVPAEAPLDWRLTNAQSEALCCESRSYRPRWHLLTDITSQQVPSDESLPDSSIICYVNSSSLNMFKTTANNAKTKAPVNTQQCSCLHTSSGSWCEAQIVLARKVKEHPAIIYHHLLWCVSSVTVYRHDQWKQSDSLVTEHKQTLTQKFVQELCLLCKSVMVSITVHN